MPKFTPNAIIKDCWSSIGNITFYHRGGQCYWKRKARPVFRGTPAQLDQQQVHLRAISAWQHLDHSVQLQWNHYAKSVPQPFPEFPSASLEVLEIIPGEEMATIRCRLTLADTIHPERWHLSARIQLTAPGVGCDPGKMRNCMGTPASPIEIGQDTSSCEVSFNVANTISGQTQAHIHYRLIDEVTGYRNNWIKLPTK